ncbi:hypothetical protein GW860_01230 [bacterium]|nr:hypothetical protein [bacterium]NCP07512.1 hypothetical protein [bacterium]
MTERSDIRASFNAELLARDLACAGLSEVSGGNPTPLASIIPFDQSTDPIL